MLCKIFKWQILRLYKINGSFLWIACYLLLDFQQTTVILDKYWKVSKIHRKYRKLYCTSQIKTDKDFFASLHLERIYLPFFIFFLVPVNLFFCLIKKNINITILQMVCNFCYDSIYECIFVISK